MSSAAAPPTTSTRVARGVRVGLACGIVLALWVVVLMLLHGGSTWTGRGGHRVPGLALMALYLITGVVGGAVVGLAAPRMRQLVVACAVGVLIAAPFAVGVLWTSSGAAPTGGEDELTVVISSVVLGCILGFNIRKVLLQRDARAAQARKV